MKEYLKVLELVMIVFLFCFVFKKNFILKYIVNKEKSMRERLVKLSFRKIRREQMEDKVYKGKERVL